MLLTAKPLLQPLVHISTIMNSSAINMDVQIFMWYVDFDCSGICILCTIQIDNTVFMDLIF